MAPQNTTLIVDAKVYYAVAKDLATLRDQVRQAVTGTLVPGLSSTGGMAGAFPAVGPWSTEYKNLSGEVRDATIACAAALDRFADVLKIAGYNWEMAEYNNTSPGQRAAQPPAKPVPSAAPPISASDFPALPDPNRDNGPGILLAPSRGGIPTSVPNGRTDLLATAAKTWTAFSNSEIAQAGLVTLRQAGEKFDAITAPEVPDIVEGLAALREGISDIFRVAGTLGDAVQRYHDGLVTLRTALADAGRQAFPLASQVSATVETGAVNFSADLVTVLDLYRAIQVFDGVFASSPLAGVLASTKFLGILGLEGIPKMKALAKLPLLLESGNPSDNTALQGDLDKMATWEGPASTLTTMDLAALDKYGPQMKHWALLAVKYGREAGVDPRLVLAMVLQEGAPLRTGLDTGMFNALKDPSTYRPDPRGPAAGVMYDTARYLSSQPFVDKRGVHLDGSGVGNSIGLTNQKEDPFNAVKAKYPDKFNGQEWSDLVGNDDLAVKAAAYNLRMLRDDAASHATPEVRAGQPLNQFLGSGYNAGGLVARSQGVAAGHSTFQNTEVEHGQSTLNVVNLANDILVGSGAFSDGPF
ncbi:hypothetical protein [Nocardia altamirensis]|uniref:hypothetical protein n=1 Tax=Nocardia altamirensis TaxID=472158 RepID=UPI00114D2F62|nr:hypothetical protein [Nocardia altamirensis]